MLNLHSIDGYFCNHYPQPDSPRVLIYDIETAKMVIKMMTYALKQQSPFLDPMTIERDIWMVCVAWKWLGESVTASTSVLNDPERFLNNYADDYHVVKTLHSLISNADIIVAHNGDAFDWKVFTSRCIAHNLPPPPKPRMVDTLKIARREFKFSSNQLRYLAKFLDVAGKDQSPDWNLVATGDKEAIGYCEQYCRQDVRTLEQVYLKLRPYATNHPNLTRMLLGQDHILCPVCLSANISGGRGWNFNDKKKYERFQCKDCGKFTDERKIVRRASCAS